MYFDFVSALTEEVIGQPRAVQACARAMVRASDRITDENRPAAVLLVAGPPGSGKRRLTNTMAAILTGDVRRLISVVPALHADAGSLLHHLWHMCAADPSPRAAGAPVPRVVLVEQVERCAPATLDLLTFVLSRGHLPVAPGCLIDQRRTIFVLETDLVQRELEQMLAGPVGFQPRSEQRVLFDARLRSQMESSIRSTFPQRLLSLVDELVLFGRMWDEDLRFVLDRLIGRLIQGLATRGVLLHVEDAARAFLLERGHDRPHGGARGIRRAVDRHLRVPLTSLLSSPHAIPAGSTVFARRSMDGLAFFVPHVAGDSGAELGSGRP